MRHYAAFDEIVEPAVRDFEPGLVLVAAGFDAHRDDPLAEMAMSAEGFRELARRCSALGPRVGSGSRRWIQPRDAARARRGRARRFLERDLGCARDVEAFERLASGRHAELPQHALHV